MIRLSAFADEAYVSFDGQLSFLQELGLKWLEIRFVDGRNVTSLTETEAREVRKKLDDAGIGISAVASPVGKYRLDEPFAPHVELLKRTAGIAHVLGTDNIRIFSFYPAEGRNIDDSWNEVSDRLGRFAEIACSEDVVLLHENESAIFGHSAENCAKIGEKFCSDHFALVYDPANFVWGEGIVDNVDRCWPLMKGYVRHIHLKDWALGSVDIGSLPGDGDGQIEKLVIYSVNDGYSGFMTLEPHLSSGGQFGGSTSPEQFRETLSRISTILKDNEIAYE